MNLFAPFGSTAQFKSTVASGGSPSAFLGSSTAPSYAWKDTAAAVDAGLWDFIANAGTLSLRAVKDDNTAASNIMVVSRTGLTINSVVFSGNLSTSGNITASGIFIGPGYQTSNGTGSSYTYNDVNVNNLVFRTGPSTAYKYTQIDAGGNFYSSGDFHASLDGSYALYARRMIGPATPANLYIDPGAGGLYLNYYSGAGYTYFCNGASGIVGSVSSAGLGTFVGLSISGGSTFNTVAGNGILQVSLDGQTSFANAGIRSRTVSATAGDAIISMEASGTSAVSLRHVRGTSGVTIQDSGGASAGVTASAFSVTSAAALKNIVDRLDAFQAFERVMALKPTRYSLKADPKGRVVSGLVVEEAPDEITDGDGHIDLYAMVTELVSAFQHLARRSGA